jgi:hypothetical protein
MAYFSCRGIICNSRYFYVRKTQGQIRTGGETRYSKLKIRSALSITLAGLAMTSVSACAKNGHVKNDYCFIARPIYLSDDDLVTKQTEIEILQHNEVWEHVCE